MDAGVSKRVLLIQGPSRLGVSEIPKEPEGLGRSWNLWAKTKGIKYDLLHSLSRIHVL